MSQFFYKTFCLEVWGDYACFTRPEMKVERVSYDVPTPSAVRAIFEAIFWKPAIRWQVEKIEVLNPIKWISVRRNEVSQLASNPNGFAIDDVDDSGKLKYRQQRAGLFLRDVRYRLHARLVYLSEKERSKSRFPIPEYLHNEEETAELNAIESNRTSTENPGKYNAMFERRARKGQCFNQPYLGCREFSCHFRLVEELDKELIEKPAINESRDLGFMLYDMDFDADLESPPPAFFRAKLENGVVAVPDWNSEEVRR